MWVAISQDPNVFGKMDIRSCLKSLVQRMSTYNDGEFQYRPESLAAETTKAWPFHSPHIMGQSAAWGRHCDMQLAVRHCGCVMWKVGRAGGGGAGGGLEKVKF